MATGAAQSGGDANRNQREASILSPRGQVIVDERTNSLMVTETAEKLEELRRLIKLIDVPIRQVLIEARIVIASTDFSQQIGVQWGGAGKDEDGNKIWSIGGSQQHDLGGQQRGGHHLPRRARGRSRRGRPGYQFGRHRLHLQRPAAERRTLRAGSLG